MEPGARNAGTAGAPGENRPETQVRVIFTFSGLASKWAAGSMGIINFRPGTRCSAWAMRDRRARRYNPACREPADWPGGRSKARSPRAYLAILFLVAML